MYRVILILIFLNTQPVFSQTQSIQIKTDLAHFSERFLGVKNKYRYSNKDIAKLDLIYVNKNLTSQLSLNYNQNNTYTLDGSYLQYTSGIITFGVGSIGRNWSFSDNTSLILTQNARPTQSIYLKLENKFNYDWLPSEANWSFESFNGINEGALNNTNSILTGFRAILTPVKDLQFELVQTSQWGGKGYSSGISDLKAAVFSDTNIGTNSNINKMAGFGISYKIPTKMTPFRIYGQAIGEDEAGNLPSCYAYLAGLEWKNMKFKYPITLGIETIDTRINRTKNGYCGPNTMYNNGTYSYTNYGKTMGAAIDTEGTSKNLFIRSQISQNIKVKLETKSIVINDNNWSGHRLSSDRQSGFINSLGLSWTKDKIKFNGDIYSQDFNLDKANIKNGYGISFSSSIIF
ncbi:capsule assembly Wzi family protein [Amylibacter sp.]|nr:capsule assembly Wzi family protein [Amylibacter sp.]